ncbi:type II toxin-antitoxin system HicB family antitoxin [Neomoorella mulderi]|uniref:Antitoxin HicB n=1 Tax=Moorella mulderi DSM 14980 TaxID=1122241 RepID=A0A151AYH9_9FIRM|nr:type II toxin-antitoxin system HicB family antitoxin [Moorella mulderi]KYH32691.1 antitoxin HicB [Moorella mulderi DSM 14980]
MDKKTYTAKYIYPAVFDPCEEGGYCVTFPDLPGCITEGDTLEEAYEMAKEALSLHLWGLEDDGDPIPKPTSPADIKVPEGGFVSLIEVWMVPIRDKMANKAVNKMLTLPRWLNDLAEEKQVNFSYVLQNALKEYLGVSEVDKPIIKFER